MLSLVANFSYALCNRWFDQEVEYVTLLIDQLEVMILIKKIDKPLQTKSTLKLSLLALI
jgi:hypothetical protein